MAYQTSSIRSDVTSLSLTIINKIKTYFQHHDSQALDYIRSCAPNLATELSKYQSSDEGMCLVPLVGLGLCIIKLSENDYQHPAQIHARRTTIQPDQRTPRSQQDRLRDAQGQAVSERVHVPFGTGATFVGAISTAASDELMKLLNSGITTFRHEKMVERMTMNNTEVQIFDNPRNTQFNDIVAAQRLLCACALVRQLKYPDAKMTLSPLKMHLATHEMGLSQFVMMHKLHPMIEQAYNETPAHEKLSMQSITGPHEPASSQQFIGLVDRDVKIISHLRQPGCVGETRVKLSGGILLTKSIRTNNSASSGAAMRERIQRLRVDKAYTEIDEEILETPMVDRTGEDSDNVGM